MSRYSVRFVGSNQERDEQALAECKWYLGDKFEKAVECVAVEMAKPAPRKTLVVRRVAFLLTWVGIQGRFPVRAMMRAALKRQ